MKLLLDQNLSSKLVGAIALYFPGSEHVRNLGMKESSDTEIWKYAILHEFVIVSKDADFHQRSFANGFPPKVIGILGGNCPTSAILNLLTSNVKTIENFYSDTEAAFLSLVIERNWP